MADEDGMDPKPKKQIAELNRNQTATTPTERKIDLKKETLSEKNTKTIKNTHEINNSSSESSESDDNQTMSDAETDEEDNPEVKETNVGPQEHGSGDENGSDSDSENESESDSDENSNQEEMQEEMQATSSGVDDQIVRKNFFISFIHLFKLFVIQNI